LSKVSWRLRSSKFSPELSPFAAGFAVDFFAGAEADLPELELAARAKTLPLCAPSTSAG
jgi:hypothetical protein